MKYSRRIDLAEQAIGACVLAFPVAVTEEVWNLSEQLAPLQVLLIAAVSCLFLSFFIYYVHAPDKKPRLRDMDFTRVVSTYAVTLLICATILALVGKLPLFSDTLVALKRVVLVAFPASFSATVVDSLKS